MPNVIKKEPAVEKPVLSALPLFAGVDGSVLDRIAASTQIRDYKKGKLLFMEREPSSRLYIILSGWVKLFKGNATGDETILEMLGAGQLVAESAVFLGVPFPANAQVSEDAVLLSLPAPILREEIRNNATLALNMISGISKHTQSLIHQIEATRLKTANERVGWFLLKLLIEAKHTSKEVHLPYDKATIASYLDMTPETFSRTLKQFRDHGFKVENDFVVLPDIRSLCSFCDSDTAATCHKRDATQCP